VKSFRQFATWLPTTRWPRRAICASPSRAAHHAGRRRDSFAECRAAPASRPLRLRAPREVLPGRAQPREAPEKVDIVIFPRETRRTCTQASSSKRDRNDAARLISFLNDDLLKGGKKKVRSDSGVGIKPISVFGTKRLVRYASNRRFETGRKTVTLVHKRQHPEIH